MSKRTATKRRATKRRGFGRKKAEPTQMTLEPGDMAVLQDFQLGINHLNAAMGRFLGHVGVQKYGLTEGNAYQFNPDWKNGTVDVRAVPKQPEPVPGVQQAPPAANPVKLEQ